MGLEQNNEQHYREVVDKFHDPAASYSMTVRDYVMRPTVDDAAIVITLPLVSEAKGRLYSIECRGTVTAVNTVTIQDNNESESWEDIVLSVANDGVLLYSDGLSWTGKSFHGYSPVHINTAWPDSVNDAAFLVAADKSGTALALGASVNEIIVSRTNITAAVTGGSNFMAEYTTMATSAAMDNGFIIGHYIRVNLNHQAFENYAIWGRMAVNVAQATSGLTTCNQYIGVFGSVSFATGAHDLRDTGGGYGVLGTASIASGGTIDQPLIGGYFEANAVDAQAGLVTAARARLLGYCDYGLDVLNQTNNNIAGIHLLTQDAARLGSGIKFEASAVGGQGYIHHAFRFLDADMSDGAYVTTAAITDADDADGLIKIDCAGTHYYIPFYDEAHVDKEWADQ